MKYKLFLISMLLLVFGKTGFCNNETGNKTDNSAKVSENNTIKIQCSPELYNLILLWSTNYSATNRNVNINIDKISDNQVPDDTDISFILGNFSNDSFKNAEWSLVVGHDAIVPIINAKNPWLTDIYQKGISAKKIAGLFHGNKELNWSMVLDLSQNIPLHCYLYENPNIVAGLAKFTKTDPSLIEGNKVASPEDLIAAVQNDIYAVGFCKLKDIRKPNTNEWVENIRLFPVDKNENGRIDNFENIYHTPDAFARGAWIGKYPSALRGNMYAVATKKPTDESTLQFLTWVISKGGHYLNAQGYSELASADIQSNLAQLTGIDNTVVNENTSQASGRWILILSALIILGIILAFFLRKVATTAKLASNKIHITPILNENTIEAPKGLYFDKTHTWTFIEKDGMVKIGIDDFLQHITGTITRVIMKEPGETVRKGEKILTIIRFGKQLNIYSPITGTIKVQNQLLHSNSQLLNTAPYSDGWVYLVEPKNWLREIQFMFMANTYKDWLKDEFTRLKDFFAVTVRSNSTAYEQIILQDGGELSDKILAEMEPEVWEDFQTKFIDTAK